MFALSVGSSAFACPHPKLVEDVNEDGVVDMLDVAIVAKAFASYPGHPRWNSRADVDGNNIVDIADVAQVLKVFGTTSKHLMN